MFVPSLEASFQEDKLLHIRPPEEHMDHYNSICKEPSGYFKQLQKFEDRKEVKANIKPSQIKHTVRVEFFKYNSSDFFNVIIHETYSISNTTNHGGSAYKIEVRSKTYLYTCDLHFTDFFNGTYLFRCPVRDACFIINVFMMFKSFEAYALRSTVNPLLMHVWKKRVCVYDWDMRAYSPSSSQKCDINPYGSVAWVKGDSNEQQQTQADIDIVNTLYSSPGMHEDVKASGETKQYEDNAANNKYTHVKSKNLVKIMFLNV